MLIPKILRPPQQVDKFKDTLTRLAELSSLYSQELGLDTFGLDIVAFLKDWQEGNIAVVGFYDGDKLEGFAISTIGNLRFSAETKMLTIEHIFVVAEKRDSNNVKLIKRGIDIAKAYCSENNIKHLMICADLSHVAFLEQLGGNSIYTSIEIPIEG